MHKAKKDDFKIEEEVRNSKTKFEDASEDVTRRMQDIQDTEPESISALSVFLEAELNYHERAAEELRRVQQAWVHSCQQTQRDPLQVSRARSNTSRSWQGAQSPLEGGGASPVAERVPIRRMPSSGPPPALPGPSQPGRQPLMRASTYGSQPTPLATLGRGPYVARAGTDTGLYGHGDEDVFRDDESTGSGDGSVGWGARSASSATSCDSILRVASGGSSPAVKKAPPPPPPSRSKKPPPPVPTRKTHLQLG